MDWHCVQVDLVTGGGDREAEYITAGRLQCGPVCSVGVPTALAGHFPSSLWKHTVLLAKR